MARAPHSIAASKVRGHTTEVQVRKAEVKKDDKHGNDSADRAADLGGRLNREGTVEIMHWLSKRRKSYTKLRSSINRLITVVMNKYHRQRSQTESHTTITDI